VQVRAAEIGVEQDDALAERRQEDAEVRRKQRLPRAALAAADRDDPPRRARLRLALARRLVGDDREIAERIACFDHDVNLP
jgi:hypothetical protein